MKKAQITIFVIVGILILIILGIILFRVNQSKKTDLVSDKTYQQLNLQAKQHSTLQY